MNQERKEELVVRWMDDVTLSASEKEELNRILEAEPELQELRAGHSRMREELKATYREVEDVPYGDFFQTKLQQAIRDSEEELPSAKMASSWKDSLRWWLAPVAVGAMAVAFLAGTRVGNGPTERRLVVASAQNRPLVYTPEGGVTSTILNADAQGTSVILLDGLQPIPDSYDLMAERKNASDLPAHIQLISTEASPQVY